jgi:hypothetical protein
MVKEKKNPFNVSSKDRGKRTILKYSHSVFIVVVLTIAKSWMGAHQQMNGNTHTLTHTHTSYSAIKNKIMSFARKWMEWDIIILSGISSAQEDKFHIFLYVESRKQKIT